MDIEKVAYLARLSLKEEERELLKAQLESILHFVEQLGELNTEGVEPFVPDFEATPMREDEPQNTLSQAKALMNAPQAEKGFFVVPRVVEY
ncbi:MAG: Asp-tRNA(Asn)/Glu-tRNA(Gln) amidotransferase subunit GatC [Aquificota bacterium]|nr:MAG: Asp-tRNA(Asn)/Glu-tRNA(Gln) amidotransferase subunit GatC [Aquificota bacterium]